MSVRRRNEGELRRHAREVGLAVQEAEPARLVLLDDRDLDAVVERQALAVQALGERQCFDVVGRGLAVEADVAIGGVLVEDDARGAPPRAQAIRPGADGMGGDVVAVGLDHLARDADGIRLAEGGREARPRRRQPELDRVAVERAQALDLGAIVERLLLAQCALAQGVEAEDAVLVERAVEGALGGRVVHALEREDVVVGHQFARLALERRVVGEEGAAPQAHRPGFEISRRLGHRLGRARHAPHRQGQGVVAHQALEDVGDDPVRIQVARLGGIEAGLGSFLEDAQDIRSHCRFAALRGRARPRAGADQQARARSGETAAIGTVRHLLQALAGVGGAAP